MKCLKHVGILSCLLCLAGCSSGGGGSGSGGGVPANNDDTTINEPEEASDDNGLNGSPILPDNFTPDSSGSDSPNPLDKLIGKVTFTSQFSHEDTLFNDVASFSTIEILDGVELVSDTAANTACTFVDNEFEFYCAHLYDSSARDLWYFDMGSNDSGSGNWEFCSEDIAADDCVVDLLDTPDGSVSVNVSAARSSAQKLQVPANMQLIRDDVETYKRAGDLQSLSGQARMSEGGKRVEFSRLISILEGQMQHKSAQ